MLSALEGINGTVFMYGQTGSGKTYTMLGDHSKEIREKNSANPSITAVASVSSAN